MVAKARAEKEAVMQVEEVTEVEEAVAAARAEEAVVEAVMAEAHVAAGNSAAYRARVVACEDH